MQKKYFFTILHIGLIYFIGVYNPFPLMQGTQALCWAQGPSPVLGIQPPAANPQMQSPANSNPSAFPPGPTPTTPGSKTDTPSKPYPQKDNIINTSPAPSALQRTGSASSPQGRQQNIQPSTFISNRLSDDEVPQRGLVTLNFDDADVFTIIQTIFGNVLKVNYVIDPRIKGRVTFRAVAPVPFEKVLPLMEVILRLNGIGVVEESGLYRLVPISDISKEPSPVSFGRDPAKIPLRGKALLQVVPILYIPSSEALKLITPFTSSNAVLIDVPKASQIIIVDTDANVKRLLQLIEIFDNEQLKITKPQVFVYSVQNGKAKDIANVLQQTFLGARSSTAATTQSSSTGAQPTATAATTGYATYSQASSSGPMLVADFTKFIPDEVTNSIIILSTPEEYLLIKAVIDKMDIIPRQVIIEGLIAQVTLTDNLSLGLAAWINGTVGNFKVGGGVGGAKLSGVDITQPAGTGLTLFAIDNIGSLQFLITSLAADSRAKLLATPHILVSDNREAKIQVGQQVPLVTSETYGSTTVAPQRTIQYRDIGIILKVKPRVNEGGLVSLELYQEVSTYDTIQLFSNETQIILNNNNATTNVVVQDGQTIVIGGLIREDTTKSRSGIPLLSKIPYIGWIFGGWIDNKQRTEIIILLTPRVVKNQKEASAVTSKYIDNMADESKGRITKEELIKGKPVQP